MWKKLTVALLGFGIVSIAGAANSPDSIGRSIKYLDTSAGVILSIYLPPGKCLTDLQPPVPVTLPVRCILLPATTGELFNVPDVGVIDVAANGARSLLTLTMNPQVSYTFSNTAAGAIRKYSNILIRMRVAVESAVLNDANLINPRTNLPFNGKIEVDYVWVGEQRMLEASSVSSVSARMPFEAAVLSRKGLTSVYGLSAARAAQVFSQPIRVRFGLIATGSAVSSAFINAEARLLGD